MLSASEDVTRNWIKRKGQLISAKPKSSRFSFTVCLAIVFSLAFGFLGGFISAGLAISDNYSTVYENVLTELEETRELLKRERKNNLARQDRASRVPAVTTAITTDHLTTNFASASHSQTIFRVFSHATNLLQKNDKAGGCAALKNILNIKEYSGEWKDKSRYLLNKNCL